MIFIALDFLRLRDDAGLRRLERLLYFENLALQRLLLLEDLLDLPLPLLARFF